ncbi:MAG: copper amine oxidase N-terminal domain-containing protein, partial [Clostridiales bacterium]|nr:copper amine oxidase N-terminal domain-containing protein [Clostridiales bacterium]
MKCLFKKLLAVLLALTLAGGFTMVPTFAAPDNGGEGNYEDFYQAVYQLVQETWDDSFFGTATLAVGSDMLIVDGRAIKLGNKAEVQNGELILPSEVFVALGALVYFDSQVVSVTKKGANIEIT